MLDVPFGKRNPSFAFDMGEELGLSEGFWSLMILIRLAGKNICV